MAGVVGSNLKLSQEEMIDIINNPDHTLNFNPMSMHLFTDENGLAVKDISGKRVHYNTKVYVQGGIEYWRESEAPKAERGVPSQVKYIDQEGVDWSALPNAPQNQSISWDDIIVSKDRGIVNRFLEGLKKTYSIKDFFVWEFINSTESLGIAEEEATFKKIGIRKRMNVAEGAQRFMEMVMNTAGRVEMIMKYGAPKMTTDGIDITIRDDTKGIFQIFENFTMPEYQDFVKYAVARRARALGEKENLIPEANIKSGLALETDKFKTAFDEYQKYNRGLLSFLVETGIIDEKQKQNLAKYDYIPFYRIIEEESYRGGVLFKSDVLGPNVSQVFNNPDAQIKEYRGGKEKIGDLLENVFRNTQAFVSSGLKNVAMKKAVNVLKQAEIGTELTQKEALLAKKDLKRKVIQYNENVINKKGKVVNKKIYYDVTDNPHIYASLAAMNPRQTAGLFKLMERLAKIFREGITHAPPFMIANLIRGEMAALVTVDAPLTPAIDTIKGLNSALKESETVQEMKLLSGVGGYAMGDDYRDSAEAIKRQLRMRHRGYKIIDSPQAVTDLLAAGWGKLTKVGEATELATREAIYRKLLDQGMSKADAAYEALNVINFNRRGAAQTNLGLFMNSLMPLVPFLNARFQGLYRTFEPMTTGKQANRNNTLLKGLMLMGANVALYSLMSQDDRWRDEPMHRKLGYHIIYPNMIGLEDVLGDEPILIPRAFEVGAIFTTIPELLIDGMTRESGDYVAEGLKHTLINTFQFNPIPQALIPAIEVTSNYDFFTGREIDTASQRRYLPSERVGPTTPEAARLLSKASGETLSPNQISQLLEGYLGTLGGYALTAFDVMASEMGLIPTRPTGVFGSSPPAKFAEALGFGRFRKPSPDPSNRWIGEFYELKNEVDTVYATINMLRRDGRSEQANELMDENKGLLRFRPQLNAMNEQLRIANLEIRRIRLSDKLTGDQKTKRLNTLFVRRNNIARRVDKILEKIRQS